MRISRDAGTAWIGAALTAGLVAIPVGALSAASAEAASAAARPPKVAGLSITLGDGRQAVRTGDRVTYTMLVRNAGATSAPRLKITQTLPAGLKFVSASQHGAVAAGKVTWHAGLPAGRTDALRVVAQVTRTPPKLLRLASVACAAVQGGKTPVVCAADLDRLPAAAAAAGSAHRAGPTGRSPVGYVVAGLAILAAAALGLIVASRSRMRRRPGRSSAKSRIPG